MAESQQAQQTPPSQRYRIIGKYIYRASTQDFVQGTRPDGSPNIVRQNGPIERLEVGTILDDVTPKELAAMGDRLELVTEDEERQQQAALEAGVLPMTFAPERGVHEPTGGPNTLVQKPPLSGDEVAGLKAGQAAVRKLEADQAEQRAKLDKDLEDARAKAMVEGAEQAQRQQEERSRRGSAPRQSTPPAGGTPPPRPPAASAPAPSEGTPRPSG